tara:strand:+ start:91 stop:480 length:390 start_codon:yes stop_codon:yes gene_type:complete
MAGYHPPKIITNNAAPVLAADLAYEAHGKCGCETIILNDGEGFDLTWDAANPAEPSGVVGCVDYSHVYKIVALENTNFRTVIATNLSAMSQSMIETGFSFKTGSEIFADFTYIKITTGMIILYRDCDQS